MSNSTLKLVDHTYRDFSTYLEDGGRLFKHKKCHKNFPAQLHKILSDPEHSEVVTWMPHGRAFKVLNKDVFVSSVISKYTTCTKYESFTRQLNSWGFKRLYQTGPDQGCYYHECFLRGLPKLTTLIIRLPPNMGKTTPYPVGEPNFYLLSEQFPLPLASSPTSSRGSSDVVSFTNSSTSVVSTMSSGSAMASANHQAKDLPEGVKPLAAQESSPCPSQAAQYHDRSISVPSTQESSSSLAKDESMEPLPLHAQHYPPLPPYGGSSSVMLTTTAPTSHHFPHRPHTWNYYPPPVHDGQQLYYAPSSPPFQLPRYQEYFGHPRSEGYPPHYPVDGHGTYPTVHRPYLPPPPNLHYQYYQQQQPQHHSLHNQYDSSFQSPVVKQVGEYRRYPPTTAGEEHVEPQVVHAQYHQQQQPFLANDVQDHFHWQPPMQLPPPPPPSTWESCHNNGKDDEPSASSQPLNSDNNTSDHRSA